MNAPNMSDECRALIVDDEELYARVIGRELEKVAVPCDLAFSCQEALRRCEVGRYQVILLDHKLPDDDGIRLIPLLRSRQPNATLFMMTAYQTISNAVQAIRQGAEDYMVKEANIKPIIDRVLEVKRRQELRRATSGWRDHQRGGLLGSSPGIMQVVDQLQKIARSSETTVLITGETGVGKEVAGRYLHGITKDEERPFLAVDCLAMPENLTESLLFGHEKGAFTGANQLKTGLFEEARDGTLFLDEIGDMSLLGQGKLLRVLESRTFRRLGSTRDSALRARVVAATNVDLPAFVKEGRFREDLYQRLHVFPVWIPPLRERGEDVLILANHFLRFYAERLGRKIAPLSGEVSRRLLAYDYPGNVRELKNIIERLAIITESGEIEPQQLPERVLQARDHSMFETTNIPMDFVPGMDTLDAVEQRMIRQALRRAKGVRTEAAKLLGISRFQLLRRLEKYGIQRETDRDD